VVVELATQGTTFFHGAHELVSAAVKIDGFCMSEAGLSVRGDLRNNRKPQPAKTVLPNKHSMNTLVVFLAALNVLIWGHNVVMIAGIIGSIISGGIVI
jgi:hypothetical protein